MFSLINEVQKSMGLPPLQKIDPNTHEVKKPEKMSSQDYLGQAALPVVLTGIYKYTRTEEGNADILKGDLSGNLLSIIFGKQKDLVVEKVAESTGNTTLFTEGKMEDIARESVHVIRRHLKDSPTSTSVKDLLTAHRLDILIYLPASLQIGKLLNDETLDDRTNKMEGPVSGFMHAIGQVFSSSGNDKKKEENF